MKALELKHKIDVALFVMRQTSGFGLAIGFFAFVQAIAISLFFANIFYMKVFDSLELVIGNTKNAILGVWALAIVLGLMAGLVIELGSFFFAVNGMIKSSILSAAASGFLSIASYHNLLLSSEADYILIAGVLLLGLYPAIFVGLASHELAKKMEKEKTDEEVLERISEKDEPPTKQKPVHQPLTHELEFLNSIGIN